MFKKAAKLFSFFALTLVFSWSFFVIKECQAAGEVVINEIAWMGSADDANNEWLELKNTTDSDIDLSGWTLEAEDGSPKIELTEIISANGYFLLERTDENSSPAQEDQIYSGSLGNSGEKLELKNSSEDTIDTIDMSGGWTAGDNSSKQTAEFCNGLWQTSAIAGGTPKAPNTCSVSDVEENSKENESEKNNYSEEETNNENEEKNCGEVVINEFVSDPEEGETEWIELYSSKNNCDLSGWYLTDGSGAKTIFDGKLNGHFFLIEKPKGALNNAGDEINLFSSAEKLTDSIVYGDWGDGKEKNVPAPVKGQSIAKTENGFVITLKPTPGQANIIEEAAAEEAEEKTSVAKISITEILPNPIGSDRKTEFIELKNNSDQEADLTGWSVAIEGGRIFTFGKFFAQTAVIPAEGCFVLYRSKSNLVMNNNGGKIRLFKPGSSRAAQILEYGEAPEGAALADTSAISENASEATKKFLLNSFDPNQWVWTYRPTPGRANEILVLNRPPEPTFFLGENVVTGTPLIFDASDSIDRDGDSLSFSWNFGDGIEIAGETVTHTFLKNGQYEIKLSISDGQTESIFKKIIVLPADFKNTAPAKTAAPQEKNSSVSANKTPIVLNENLAAILTQSDDGFPFTPLEEIKNKKAGENVSVSGVIIVPPAVFGTQYFYIVSPQSTSGTTAAALKIYNFKKDFPELKIGDLLEINGQVMQNKEEKYLKIASQEDIKISGAAELPEPIEVKNLIIEDLNKFLTIEGEIIKKDGSRIFLETSSGTVSVYLKSGAGIDKTNLKSGTKVRISGLAVIISQDIELLPRNQDDIKILSATTDNKNSSEKNSKNNKKASTSDWILPERQDKNKIFIYALIIITLLTIPAFILIKKKFKK